MGFVSFDGAEVCTLRSPCNVIPFTDFFDKRLATEKEKESEENTALIWSADESAKCNNIYLL